MIAMVLQMCSMYAVYLVFTCIFFGICSYLVAFAADLEHCLTTLDGKIQQFDGTERNNERVAYRELKGILHGTIAFHADVMQLSEFKLGRLFLRTSNLK